MEKDKRKFNLARVLSIYLFKKNKSLTGSPAHCNGYRSAPAAAPADDDALPPSGNHWTVK